MKEQNTVTGLRVRSLPTAIVLVLCVFAFALGAMAQTPLTPAGTKIGNQASATYTDASSITRTATSNAVYTLVQQVAALTLTPGPINTKTGAPGTQVAYPQTLTNSGNGNDTYDLTVGLTGTGFSHTGLAIYADANGDGIPDNSVPVTSVTIAPGSANAFNFVVVGLVPAGTTAGTTGSILVTATSRTGSKPAASVTETTTATGNAVISVTKAMNQNTGLSPSGPYTVSLTYTNNGNATATAVKFEDSIPAGMTYVAGSGRWSVTGTTTLTDGTGDVQPAAGSPNIDFSYTSPKVTATVNSIAPGVSGMITFQVTIDSGLAPKVLQNTASVTYNDSVGSVGPISTNTVPFTVLQTAGVTITDVGGGNTTTVALANQGGTVSFTNVVKNTGNGTDTMNVAVTNNVAGGFPAGTTFALFKSDGATPLIDTNGDGIPDVGPIAANASYNVIVKATLPSGMYTGPFSATAAATSTFDSSKTSSMTDKLTAITASTVDITNTAAAGNAGAQGTGAGPEGTAVVTNTTGPGTTTAFTLYVKNTSGVADSYDLSAGQTAGGGALPGGWNVTFRTATGSCSTPGGVITNTGVLNANGNALVCAFVTVPAGYYSATPISVFFRATSPTSAATDVIFDAVTVSVLHALSLTPNNTGQIFPNGSVVYKHIVVNGGNTSEAVTVVSADNLTGNGWTSIVYQDDGTGAGSIAGSLDPKDSQVTGATVLNIAAGAQLTLFVKVSAPAGAAIGAVDTTTITASYASLQVTATDGSTVIAGDLRLVKMQALDASCTGTPGTYTQADITAAGAVPGACVFYQITATNQGTANVSSVLISDATPSYTVYVEPGGAAASSSISVATDPSLVITHPTVNNAGTVSLSLGTNYNLAPGASVTLTFVVKIQ